MSANKDAQVIKDTIAHDIIFLFGTPYCYLSIQHIIDDNNPLIELVFCVGLSACLIFVDSYSS